MISQSNIYPPKINIEKIEHGLACARLTRNVKQLESDEDIIYEYEETKIQVVDRPNLEDYITEHFDVLFEDGLTKERTPAEATSQERIEALESALLALMGV